MRGCELQWKVVGHPRFLPSHRALHRAFWLFQVVHGVTQVGNRSWVRVGSDEVGADGRAFAGRRVQAIALTAKSIRSLSKGSSRVCPRAELAIAQMVACRACDAS
jgi:hypothetical protein